MHKDEVKTQLNQMLVRDEQTRARLAASSALFGGYHPEMRAVHEQNADALLTIFEAGGWPRADLVGANAEMAAWTVLQHAISRPDLMRWGLRLLLAEVAAKRMDPAAPAILEDRIAAFEGRPQTYGTQLDWDEGGQLSPYPPIADPAAVGALRAAVGLSPLAEAVERMRAEAAASGDTPPADVRAWRAQQSAFAQEVGWR